MNSVQYRLQYFEHVHFLFFLLNAVVFENFLVSLKHKFLLLSKGVYTDWNDFFFVLDHMNFICLILKNCIVYCIRVRGDTDAVVISLLALIELVFMMQTKKI